MEPFRIEELEVNQIGPFEYLKLNFPKKQDPEKAEIHIFTGENGTGKTTLLECMVNQVDARKSWGKIAKFTIKYNTHIDTYQFDTLFGITISNNETILKKYQKRSKEEKYYPNDYAFFAYSGNRNFQNINVNGIKTIQDNPLDSSISFQNSINSSNLIQWIANTLTREALELVNNNIEDASQLRKNIKLLENAITDVINAQVHFKILSSLKVIVDIEGYGSGLDLDILPDGVKSIIGWIGDLLMRLDRSYWIDRLPILDRNIILFLDEIEVHLHPAWQRKILPVVQKLFKNAQIFVSTHSPFVVGSVDGAWVYRFDKTGQYATLAEGFPMLSEDAKSYDYILEEVFGIKERFGIEVEKKLAEFKLLKNQLLRDEPINEANFRTLVHELASQSTEIESIIGMELRQLKRITNKDFWELTTA